MAKPTTCGKCGTAHWSTQACPVKRGALPEVADVEKKVVAEESVDVPAPLNQALADYLGLTPAQAEKLAEWMRARKAQQMREYRARKGGS